MRVQINPWYRTGKCVHAEPSPVSGCDYCAIYEFHFTLPGVPRVGELVNIDRSRFADATFPDDGEDSDDWVVVEVAWSEADDVAVMVHPRPVE
jgi:hypothetical protein